MSSIPGAATSSSGQKTKPGSARPFTHEMRDRQARGKDPYTKDEDGDGDVEGEDEEEEPMDLDDDDDDEEEEMEEEEEEEEEEENDGLRMQIGNVPKNETYEERQTRQFALAVLDSPEQLMMYAQSTNDSIPGQRYRFMTTLCGFTAEEDKRAPRRR